MPTGDHRNRVEVWRLLRSVVALIGLLALASANAFVPYTRLVTAGATAAVGSAVFLWATLSTWRVTGRRMRDELAAEAP
jgi:hypothetical protein